MVIVNTGGYSLALHVIRHGGNFYGALGLGVLDPQRPFGRSNSANASPSGSRLSGASCTTFFFGQPNPLRDMLGPLLQPKTKCSATLVIAGK